MKKTVTKKLFLSIVFLWGSSVGILAQETATISMNFNVPDSKAVSIDNTYYTMVGEQMTLTVQVDPTEPITSVESLSYTLDGQTVDLVQEDYTLSVENLLTFNVTLAKEMTDAAISMAMKYSTANKQSVEVQGDGEYQLTVLPAIVAPQCSPSEKLYYTSSSSPISIGVQAEGSGGGTWSYSWDDGTTDLQMSFNPATASLKETTTLTLTITNVAPDNETEWYKETISYPIYVYETPSVRIQSIADDLHFYKQLPDGYWSAEVDGGGNTTEYYWYVDENETFSRSGRFNPQTVATNAIVKEVVKLVVVSYADDDTEIWRSDELFNEEYTIYPAATLSADKLTKSIYLGESVTFSPTYNNGGYPNGNVYEWSGDMEGTSKDLTVKPTTVGTYTYTLQASNNYGDVVWEPYATQTYTLNVYQIPSTVITENINYSNNFEGAQNLPIDNLTCTLTQAYRNAEGSQLSLINRDVVNVSVDNRNGSTEWSYSVTDNGKALFAPYTLSTTIGVHQLVISVVNGENEMEAPFRAEYKRSYQVYETPLANRSVGYEDSYETCGGRQVPLSISLSGGHDEGLKCQWLKDGKAIANATSTTYTDNIDYTTSGDANMKKYVIGANVTYTLNGKKRYDLTIPFNINYWPAPKNISDFAIADLQNTKNHFDGTSIDGAIRVGNTLQLSVNRAVGGYGNPSVWNYVWSRDGEEIYNYSTVNQWKSTIDEVTTYALGATKGSKDVVYTLRTSNYRDGLWADNTMSKTIRIYNKPATPSSLTKKGSGVSGTMIATTTGVSDSELEGRQYFLVFGYEDAVGNEVKSIEKRQSNPGDTRFETSFSASEVNNSSYRFFVYAMWKYDDAVTVTSGKRYIDTVNEEWDGSNYTAVTRSVIPETTSIVAPSNSIKDTQRVYTINGQLVKDSTNLASGIYIIEKIADGQRSTKKIVVK
ncbi:MAG: T9SS type A sorting domain-containing protein [Bacteroidaceae bacterium]|nr:T9SS type A sorting domain-containing protein [Bacteroidaceae bacterium]